MELKSRLVEQIRFFKSWLFALDTYFGELPYTNTAGPVQMQQNAASEPGQQFAYRNF